MPNGWRFGPDWIGCVAINAGQDGPPTAPIETVLWYFQPADPTRAPFSIRMASNKFLSTFDTALYYGYNVGNEQPSEPQMFWNIETDFESSPGNHVIENYWQFIDHTGSIVVRPFFAQINRVSGFELINIMLGPGSSAAAIIDNSTSNIYEEWTKGTTFIGGTGNQQVLAFTVPGVGTGLAILQVTADGHLKYTGPGGTQTVLANP